jgi:hypothetical protein
VGKPWLTATGKGPGLVSRGGTAGAEDFFAEGFAAALELFAAFTALLAMVDHSLQ